ncbi:MAG: hypothetical protein LBV38_06055 [Alistipes sp.]|nr:hypothetical protein [Alistipes sp.]
MEISQTPWGLTPEGEAVVLYTLGDTAGAHVQLVNLGATLVAAVVPDRHGALVDVVAESAPVAVNRVWDARVEGNRVVFSTSHFVSGSAAGFPAGSPSGVEVALEAAWHWSEEGELELVFSAVIESADVPVSLDFVPRTRFDLADGDRLLTVEGWQRNILGEAGVVVDPARGIAMRVLTSLPEIVVRGRETLQNVTSVTPATSVTYVTPPIVAGERYVQKIVWRFTTRRDGPPPLQPLQA